VSNKPHQDRALAVIVVAEGLEALHPEISVPQAAMRIDAILFMPSPSLFWGPIQGFLSDRLVVVEHFSQPPSQSKLALCGARYGMVRRQWFEERAQGSRPPLMLVLSDGRPRRVLNQFMSWCTPHPNVYHWTGSPIGEVLLVDLKRISGPTTAAMKFMLYPNDPAGRERLDALQRDVHLLEFYERMLEGIMNGQIPVRESEHKTAYQRAKAEGLEQGLEKGRRALLDVAAVQVSPTELRALEDIEDLETLQQALMEMLQR